VYVEVIVVPGVERPLVHTSEARDPHTVYCFPLLSVHLEPDREVLSCHHYLLIQTVRDRTSVRFASEVTVTSSRSTSSSRNVCSADA
jgi:hypothetical protein